MTSVFSRGALRAFFLVASVITMPMASYGLVLCFSLVLGLVYDPSQMGSTLGAEIDVPTLTLLMMPLALLWTSAPIAGLLVWAAQGQQPHEGAAAFRRRRRLRVIMAVGVISIVWVAAPMAPQPIGLPVVFMLGYIVAPSLAIAGISCGRRRVRAFSLGLSVLILLLPVSLYIGVVIVASHLEESPWPNTWVLIYWLGGIVMAVSCGVSLAVQMSLQRHGAIWRRRGAREGCCATPALFPTANCCNGDCGFE